MDTDVCNMSNKELERVVEKLKEAFADTHLQLDRVRQQRKVAEKDLEESILKRDRLRTAVGQIPLQIGAALTALDTEMQRVAVLSQQLEELELQRCRSQELREATQKEMQDKEDLLDEEEKNLNMLCAQMHQSLAEAQSCCLAAEKDLEQLQGDVKGATSVASGQQKEKQLVDKYVNSLGIRAILDQAAKKGAK
ncbi:hypothetical protein GN956_G12894 [Arapaima gigas]